MNLFYADHLVPLGDSREDADMRYARLKKAMMEKGLIVNVKKTKVFCTGEKTASTKTS